MAVSPCDRLSDGELDLWARVQEGNDALASPFFRPEFAQTVAGVRPDVAVGLVHSEGSTAFFPFQRRRFGRGIPVGSRLSDYHGIVGAVPVQLDACELLRACRLRSWDFDGVVASQAIFQPHHRRARTSPFLDLAQGFETYAAARTAAGTDQIDDIAKQEERLGDEVGTIRFESHVEGPEAVALLMRWKSEQYVRTGAVDIFAFPWVRDVVSRVHSMKGSAFAGPLSVLYAGERPVAAHLGLRSASVWHYWLPAYDRALGKYSPGLIMLLRLAKAAAAAGVTRIDLGKGDALYKRRLASDTVSLSAGSVEATAAAVASASAFRLCATVIRKTPLAGRVDVMVNKRAFT